MPQPETAWFQDVDAVASSLGEAGYLSDTTVDTTVFLADRLAKPILVEGPAGVGKTALAAAVAKACSAELIRLQCYEGLDEAKALYEWNYHKQLLRVTHARRATGPFAVADDPAFAEAAADDVTSSSADAASWRQLEHDLFSEEYLLERPLLAALRRQTRVVLLIDEIDKVDVEFEALLLEILSEHQVSVPELGAVRATAPPFVVLTSNATRDLSEALRRRCLYLALDYPDADRERAIVAAAVPEAPARLTEQLVGVVQSLRRLDLRKPPSVAETLDWARTLLALGFETLIGEGTDAAADGAAASVDGAPTTTDPSMLIASLPALLKHQSDLEVARNHLGLETQ